MAAFYLVAFRESITIGPYIRKSSASSSNPLQVELSDSQIIEGHSLQSRRCRCLAQRLLKLFNVEIGHQSKACVRSRVGDQDLKVAVRKSAAMSAWFLDQVRQRSFLSGFRLATTVVVNRLFAGISMESSVALQSPDPALAGSSACPLTHRSSTSLRYGEERSSIFPKKQGLRSCKDVSGN